MPEPIFLISFSVVTRSLPSPVPLRPLPSFQSLLDPWPDSVLRVIMLLKVTHKKGALSRRIDWDFTAESNSPRLVYQLLVNGGDAMGSLCRTLY